MLQDQNLAGPNFVSKPAPLCFTNKRTYYTSPSAKLLVAS